MVEGSSIVWSSFQETTKAFPPLKIGRHQFDPPFLLAPMDGSTDKPFRILCREMGASLAVSEMINANPLLRESSETQKKVDFSGEEGPISAQILGVDPDEMAELAQFNVSQGADIIDINMGCPAKKVCKKLAGSALMQDEKLVESILKKVVKAVAVPVTLKIRTGWDDEHKNALKIAKIAEEAGIQALTIHGRTREQRFKGEAEYQTIRQVKEALTIPVIANGDIDSIEKASQVFSYTKADGLMIGREALGNPWIFTSLRDRVHYLPSDEELYDIIFWHLQMMHDFYGEEKALRVSRKHLLWYLKERTYPPLWRKQLLAAKSFTEQRFWIEKIVFYVEKAA